MSWITPEVFSLLAGGLLLTIILTAVSTIASLILGILIGIARLSDKYVLRTLALVYIELHRNVPALVLIIFWAFAFPNLLPADLRQIIFFDNSLADFTSNFTGLTVPYYVFAALVGLTFNASAYLAELFRAGVGTIPREHLDAARTLGASSFVVLRKILIPEGVRVSFPAMSTRLIHNMKNTALAAFVSVPEFFLGIQTAITRSFRAVEFLVFAAIVYFILSYCFSFLMGRVEYWLTRRRPSLTFASLERWQLTRV